MPAPSWIQCTLTALTFITISSLLSSKAAPAAELDEQAVRSVMSQAEQLLLQTGVDVQGYAGTHPPIVEFVPANHMLLQGNDGAFIAGRVYLNEAAPEDCKHLNLLHETVHDATVKFRLFRTVPNAEVRTVIEALADRVTEAAAANPYRPRCLTHREFQFSGPELAQLAMR